MCLADLQPRRRDSLVPGLLDQRARLAQAFDRHARRLDRAAQELGMPSEAFRRLGFAAQELHTLERMRGLPPSANSGWRLVEAGRVFGVVVEANAEPSAPGLKDSWTCTTGWHRIKRSVTPGG